MSSCSVILSVVFFALTWTNTPGYPTTECGAPPYAENTSTNVSRIYPPPANFPVDTVVEYACTIGFTRNGTNFRAKCISGGGLGATWQQPDIKCQPISCGEPENINDGYRQGHLWTYRSKVEYFCNEGFDLIPSPGQIMRIGVLRYCQASGQWSSRVPQCVAKNCSVPDNPENGFAVYSHISFGSILRYECMPQMAVFGDETRVCQADGMWSGSTPQCQRVDCGLPSNRPFDSGSISILRGTLLNDIIMYHCDDGYSERAVCNEIGEWVPPPPECMSKTTTMEYLTEMEPPRTTITDKPKKVKWYCRWKLFKWMCK